MPYARATAQSMKHVNWHILRIKWNKEWGLPVRQFFKVVCFLSKGAGGGKDDGVLAEDSMGKGNP